MIAELCGCGMSRVVPFWHHINPKLSSIRHLSSFQGYHKKQYQWQLLFLFKRRIPMAKSTETKRVLVRMHGRELSAAEVDQVRGNILTHLCTFNFTTCTMDGDCEQIPQCP
jgi:hypothetical protein